MKKGLDTASDRFWVKVVKTEDCWEWTGALSHGYGQFSLYWWKTPAGVWRTKTVRAHRFAYEELVGPIPLDLEIDHICHEPDDCAGGRSCPHRKCVRPEHMRPSTTRENTLRSNSMAARYARATHCPRGHEYTEKNNVRHDGRMECRECHRQGQRRRYVPRPRPEKSPLCSRCGVEPRTSPLASWCLECARAYNREASRKWRQRQREAAK